MGFGERIPEWCVLVGLIGTGQEIHVGEEAGLGQWREALQKAGSPEQWTVHAPQRVLDEFFANPSLPAGVEASEALDLTVELRFHFAADLDEWVDGLLTGGGDARGRELAARLEAAGYQLRMTRDLDVAKDYFPKRYDGDPQARYGLLASSRDKTLIEWGIPNGFHSTSAMRLGPWYGDGDESRRSCHHLRECVTEFGAQGLELDGVLLAWGTDFMRSGNRWSHHRARRYKAGTKIRDAYSLRLNAYRVLLTRGRDGAVIFVPPLPELDATAARLQAHGGEGALTSRTARGRDRSAAPSALKSDPARPGARQATCRRSALPQHRLQLDLAVRGGAGAGVHATALGRIPRLVVGVERTHGLERRTAARSLPRDLDEAPAGVDAVTDLGGAGRRADAIVGPGLEACLDVGMAAGGQQHDVRRAVQVIVTHQAAQFGAVEPGHVPVDHGEARRVLLK